MLSKGPGTASLQASLSFSSATDKKGQKPRPAPDLPTCFEGINEKNIFSLTTVGEANYTDKKTGKTRGPFCIATHIKVPGNDRKEINFELAELTVDNLRALVNKLGIKGYASGSKFQCRHLIGKHVIYQQAYNSKIRENSAAAVKKKLNSELRKIQGFFHPKIFDQILQVNSLKSRSDDENGTSEKQTWSALADLYNNTEPDPMMDNFDDTAIKDLHNHLIRNPGYEDIDLTNFTETTDNGNDLQKYITGLFKL
jgi:hypothetical protein